MHYAFLMGVGERGCNVIQDLNRARDRERPLVECLAQALADEQLHRHVRGAASYSGVEDLDDIAVLEARGRARVFEGFGELRVALAK